MEAKLEMTESKSRKILIAFVCVIGVIFIVIGFLRWLSPEVPFITQSVDNVERIVIVAYPYFPNRKEVIYITDRIEIEQIYKLLTKTTAVRVHQRPGYPGRQRCPHFNIRLDYANEETDVFREETNGRIFRFLDTRGRHGEQGFIIGTNIRLSEYVEEIIFQESKVELAEEIILQESEIELAEEKLSYFAKNRQGRRYLANENVKIRIYSVFDWGGHPQEEWDAVAEFVEVEIEKENFPNQLIPLLRQHISLYRWDGSRCEISIKDMWFTENSLIVDFDDISIWNNWGTAGERAITISLYRSLASLLDTEDIKQIIFLYNGKEKFFYGGHGAIMKRLNLDDEDTLRWLGL